MKNVLNKVKDYQLWAVMAMVVACNIFLGGHLPRFWDIALISLLTFLLIVFALKEIARRVKDKYVHTLNSVTTGVCTIYFVASFIALSIFYCVRDNSTLFPLWIILCFQLSLLLFLFVNIVREIDKRQSMNKREGKSIG